MYLLKTDVGESLGREGGPREISVTGIGKCYAGVPVLNDITLVIPEGEIHGILGENGAGKSTLLKIIGGAVTADSGTLRLNGKPVKVSSPRDSIAHGISLISQELSLIPNRTVLENVFLGRWSNTVGLVVGGRDREHFTRLIGETGFDLDADAVVSRLSMGQAQQVEILKALARGARILCMDEPTAVLNEMEKANLLGVIRRLSAAGTTVILVSHYLQEVLEVCDRVTILRDGRHISTAAASDHTPESLVSLMVGREVDFLMPDVPPVSADAATVLNVNGVCSDAVQDISLTVRQGEIVGLAGLVGSGRSEALLALFGADKISAGSVSVNGRRVRPNSIRAAIKAGIALVPESRKDQGLVTSRSVSENIALATLGIRSVAGFVRGAAEKAAVADVSASVDLRGVRAGATIASLSGGNQQKALFAKWLLYPPAVLLVDEPTRGVDVAAKSRIHSMIVELAAKGTAVVVVSSELEEVIGLSHRVNVMRKGRLVAEFDRNAARDDVMASAFLK